MSLQGTLDTFTLAEVLELIERSRKSGALEVLQTGQDDDSGRPGSSEHQGVVYFAGGRFSAAETRELVGPLDSAEELEARVIDVCFAMFRVEVGRFEFHPDRAPPWPVRGGIEIAATVGQVQQLQRDWLTIEAVIPSLDCKPDVVDDLGGDRVVLDKAAFRVLRVIDGDRSVRELARAVGQSVLEVGRVLHDLVEAGAVYVPTTGLTAVSDLVLDTTGENPTGFSDLPEVPGLVVPSSPEGLEPYPSLREIAESAPAIPADDPVLETPPPVEPDPPPLTVAASETPSAADDDETGDRAPEPTPDRGAILRLFSSLRDG